MVEEEEFVHELINQGEEELKELEEAKRLLDEELGNLDDQIDLIQQE